MLYSNISPRSVETQQRVVTPVGVSTHLSLHVQLTYLDSQSNVCLCLNSTDFLPSPCYDGTTPTQLRARNTAPNEAWMSLIVLVSSACAWQVLFVEGATGLQSTTITTRRHHSSEGACRRRSHGQAYADEHEWNASESHDVWRNESAPGGHELSGMSCRMSFHCCHLTFCIDKTNNVFWHRLMDTHFPSLITPSPKIMEIIFNIWYTNTAYVAVLRSRRLIN